MIVVHSVDFINHLAKFSRRRLTDLIVVQQPVIDLVSEEVIIRRQDNSAITGSIVSDCVVISVRRELSPNT